MLEPSGRMWVIDWEYGGMADPYFDLGDFCVEHPLSDEEERFIITRYCGSFSEDRYARMMLHKIVADLWWSIWAMDPGAPVEDRLRLLRVRHEPGRRGCARTPPSPAFASWLADGLGGNGAAHER